MATSFELIHYFEVACPKIVAVHASFLNNVTEAIKQLSFSPKLMVIEDIPYDLNYGELIVSYSIALQ